MIEIQDLIGNIPDGKKRGYLGKLFIKAITDYYDNYGEEELDLNELVKRNFKKLILELIPEIFLCCITEPLVIVKYL